MLTKTINVSGTLQTSDGMNINVSFNYRNSISELTNIDFNFNKNEVNVFGSYNIANGKIANYSVNNGVIDDEVFEGVVALCQQIAEDPEDASLYTPEQIAKP